MKKNILILCLLSVFAQAQNKKASKSLKSTKSETVILSDSRAEYVGGISALESYIIANLKTPEKLNNDTSIKTSKVFLKFMVDKTGKVSDVSVIKGIKHCKPCNEEAIRLLNTMPNWKPAVIEGQLSDSWHNIHVTFTKK